MLLDDECEVLKDTDKTGMQMGCNKTMNAHNDLHFSYASVQSMDNSADPQLPTATFTIGLSRTITFKRMTKVVSGGYGSVSWSRTDQKRFVESKLVNGSILVLKVNDDKPTKSPIGDDIIRKTKHHINFRGDGILIAFVFCLV